MFLHKQGLIRDVQCAAADQILESYGTDISTLMVHFYLFLILLVVSSHWTVVFGPLK